MLQWDKNRIAAKGDEAISLAKCSLLREYSLPMLSLDTPADVEYGRIRAKLEVARQPIGLNDLLIGAHASALGLTLVTDNIREFNRILSVENWLEG